MQVLALFLLPPLLLPVYVPSPRRGIAAVSPRRESIKQLLK